MMRRTVYFLIWILFSILTLSGTAYVCFSGGTKSPGYAVIPMIFAVSFSQLWRKSKSCDTHDTH